MRIAHQIFCEQKAAVQHQALQDEACCEMKISEENEVPFDERLANSGYAIVVVPKLYRLEGTALLSVLAGGLLSSFGKSEEMRRSVLNELSYSEGNVREYYQAIYEEYAELRDELSFKDSLLTWQSPGEHIDDELVFRAACVAMFTRITIYCSNEEEDILKFFPNIVHQKSPPQSKEICLGKDGNNYYLLEKCDQKKQMQLDLTEASSTDDDENGTQFVKQLGHCIIGFNNLATTCYLNAALQFLLLVPSVVWALQDIYLQKLTPILDSDWATVIEALWEIVVFKYYKEHDGIPTLDTLPLYQACHKVNSNLFPLPYENREAGEALNFFIELLCRCGMDDKFIATPERRPVFTCDVCHTR